MCTLIEDTGEHNRFYAKKPSKHKISSSFTSMDIYEALQDSVQHKATFVFNEAYSTTFVRVITYSLPLPAKAT